jgi:hypothetical protein
MPETNPEERMQQAISEGIEDVNRYASEKSAVAEEAAGEVQEQLKADLEAKFDGAVNEVMILSNLSTETQVGRAFFDAAMRDKEAYVQAAFNKMMLEKTPPDQAEDVLEKILGQNKTN